MRGDHTQRRENHPPLKTRLSHPEKRLQAMQVAPPRDVATSPARQIPPGRTPGVPGDLTPAPPRTGGAAKPGYLNPRKAPGPASCAAQGRRNLNRPMKSQPENHRLSVAEYSQPLTTRCAAKNRRRCASGVSTRKVISGGPPPRGVRIRSQHTRKPKSARKNTGQKQYSTLSLCSLLFVSLRAIKAARRRVRRQERPEKRRAETIQNHSLFLCSSQNTNTKPIQRRQNRRRSLSRSFGSYRCRRAIARPGQELGAEYRPGAAGFNVR